MSMAINDIKYIFKWKLIIKFKNSFLTYKAI